MCGRYNLRSKTADFNRLFDVSLASELEPLLNRSNIAPTQTVLAVRPVDDRREAVALRWGLVPSWAKDLKLGARMINARAETVASKPSFRAAFKPRRCLIPASGFYEWQGSKGDKQPYHIFAKDQSPLAFAGLWEEWNGGADGPLQTCTILTTSANATLAPLHDRMPVILPTDAQSLWLDDHSPGELLESLLQPAADELLALEPVTRELNNVRYTGPVGRV
ncbi:MAG: SOS response-associated peptidase [Planctomycetaceae bacterium]